MKLIAIVGGIGSGKSVVSHVLRLMDYEVYDCDICAKKLMNESETIKQRLAAAFGDEVITASGMVNKPKLAEIIFNDKAALATVNGIVHPEVIADFKRCAAKCSGRAFFVETALPQESGIDAIADEIWMVEAPQPVRVLRVMERNGVSSGEVLQRMKNQDYSNLKNNCVRHIVNDDANAILPQIAALLQRL